MNLLLVLPVIIPLFTAILALLCWRHIIVQRGIAVVGASCLMVAAVTLLLTISDRGIQCVQVSNWQAPFGITLVADLFGAVMVVLAATSLLAVTVYSLGSVGRALEAVGYYPLIHVMVAGICGAFLTGDVFNLYVCFEVTLVSSFVLMAMGGERQQVEGAIKYVTLNLMASAIFLAAIGLLYGVAGTLNMADLATVLANEPRQTLVNSIAMLFLVGFGIKAAVFPLFFWLPASYHTPNVAITTLFAALLTKVGVYALIRFFTLIFVGDTGLTHMVLLVLAGLTMVTGVLGAVAQTEFRRLLSFHIISQIGYLLLGLGLLTHFSLAAMVYFMGHVIIAKTALLLLSGVTQRISGTSELRELGGFYKESPLLSVVFLVPALSLAGIPPLSGFWAKFAVVKASLEAEQYVMVVAALAVGLFTLYYMLNVWAEVFWKDRPADHPVVAKAPLVMWGPMVAMGILTLGISFGVDPLFQLANRAAFQLLDRQEYIRAVLGGAL